MEAKNGLTLPSREQHSSFFCFFLTLPNLLSNLRLAQSDHAVVQEVPFSGLHQCGLSSIGTNTDGTAEGSNLLIWPAMAQISIHSPARSSLCPSFCVRCLALSASFSSHMAHTLFCACMLSTLYLYGAPHASNWSLTENVFF